MNTVCQTNSRAISDIAHAETNPDDSHLSFSNVYVFMLVVLYHFQNHVTPHLVKELRHKGK